MAPMPRDRDKLSRMEQAVRVLIGGLGEDLDREGLRDTPKRVAKALLDCTQGYHQDTSSTLGTALFHEPLVHQGGEGVVVVRDIDFASTSEETFLPFHGRCHVAYRPKDGVVLGLSKLARLTKQYAKRLQTQERLAAAIALALQQSLECHGVAVVLQARHLSNSASPEERTSACVSGVFAAKGSAELEELLALLNLEDLPAAAVTNLDRSPHSFLPANHHPPGSSAAAAAADPGVPAPGTPDPSEKDTDGDSDDLVLEAPCCCEEMEVAVQQLLLELGEDPHRPGLTGTARRYVMSLLTSTSGYHLQQRQQPTHMPQQRQQQQQELQSRGQQQEGTFRTVPLRPAASRVACGEREEDGSKSGGGDGGLAAGVAAATGAASEACSRPRCCGVAGRDGADHHHSASSGRSGRLGATPPPASSCSASRLNGLGGARTADHAVTDSVAMGAATGCCVHAAAYCRLPPQQQHNAGRTAAAAEPAAGEVLGSGPLRGAVTMRMPFASQCEHHMLPFYGTLMVSYFPDAAGVAVPRGAVEQAVHMFTQRLQVQERITHQVADAVEALLRTAVVAPPADTADAERLSDASLPGADASGAAAAAAGAAGGEAAAGVMVVVDAAHMCMVARGVENHSGSTTTFAVRGAFATQPELRRAVLRLFREQ